LPETSGCRQVGVAGRTWAAIRRVYVSPPPANPQAGRRRPWSGSAADRGAADLVSAGRRGGRARSVQSWCIISTPSSSMPSGRPPFGSRARRPPLVLYQPAPSHLARRLRFTSTVAATLGPGRRGCRSPCRLHIWPSLPAGGRRPNAAITPRPCDALHWWAPVTVVEVVEDPSDANVPASVGLGRCQAWSRPSGLGCRCRQSSRHPFRQQKSKRIAPPPYGKGARLGTKGSGHPKDTSRGRAGPRNPVSPAGLLRLEILSLAGRAGQRLGGGVRAPSTPSSRIAGRVPFRSERRGWAGVIAPNATTSLRLNPHGMVPIGPPSVDDS